MTSVQEDFVTMVLTTVAVLNANSTVWQENVPLSALIASITTDVNEVVDLQSEQDKKHTGITDNKKAKRSKLEDDVVLIAHILAFFAATTEEAALEEQMDLQPSDLTHMTELKLLGQAKVVLDAAKKYTNDAKPYGLTADMVSNLNTHYNDFSEVLNAPRVAIVDVSDATDNIARIISELRKTIIKKLDKAMMLYRDTTLYEKYLKARIIVNSPTRHLAATGNFTDEAGNPLEDVKITIDNGTDDVLRKSSPKGNIRVQNLLDGVHKLYAEKPGFTKVEMQFTVSPPDTAKLNIVMKAL